MATTAKEIQVSIDAGVTWFLLPGGTGEWNDESEQITDTIFGQTFSSTQPGLITWTSNANALYKGFAGYVASLKQAGTALIMTAEATTLVSGKTYQIDDVARRVIDWTQTVVVDDAATPVAAADIESIDHMFGTVTFVSTFTPGGAVTFDGFYFPLTEIAKANSFTLTQTAETIDETDFATANSNSGYRVFNPGLRTVNLELGGFYDATEANWAVLEARSDIVIEINPDGSDLSVARGIFKLVTRNQSGDVGALEEESRTFNLSVPIIDSSLLSPSVSTVFSWQHDALTTLSQSIQNILTFWLSQTNIRVRYLPDGVPAIGFDGTAVITDVSLSSGLDAMNEFTANFQGTGLPTRIVESA